MSAPPGDCARVTVFVAVKPREAFDVFTREIDLWWRTGPKFRIAGKRRGQLFFEPKLGGRLFETFELPAGPRAFDIGQVTVWEPPARLALVWRGVNFKPHEETLVDVSFEPSGAGTLVRVVHQGWSKLPASHPARHGLEGAAFSRMLGMWWGDLLSSLRELVATQVASQ